MASRLQLLEIKNVTPFKLTLVYFKDGIMETIEVDLEEKIKEWSKGRTDKNYVGLLEANNFKSVKKYLFDTVLWNGGITISDEWLYNLGKEQMKAKAQAAEKGQTISS